MPFLKKMFSNLFLLNDVIFLYSFLYSFSTMLLTNDCDCSHSSEEDEGEPISMWKALLLPGVLMVCLIAFILIPLFSLIANNQMKSNSLFHYESC